VDLTFGVSGGRTTRALRERRLAGEDDTNQTGSTEEGHGMKTFTNTTKRAATVVASVVALAGAAPASGAHAREVVAIDPNLEVRVVQLGELPGFWTVDCPLAFGSATAWAQGGNAEATAVHREGFAMGVRELLRSRKGDVGVSVALRFRSAAGASTDLDRREQLAGHTGYATSFAVPGSPSVRAYSVRTAGFTTVHVAFTRGTDEFAVAVRTAKRAEVGALQQALATAAGRVAGRI
jgi:hypothetical protein